MLSIGFANAQMTVSVTSITDVTCNGGTDGGFTVVVTNSSPGQVLNYNVAGSLLPSVDTTATTMTFTGLSASLGYVIVVTDPLIGAKSANLSISSPKGAAFTYAATAYCKNTSNPTPTINANSGPYPGNMAGVFSASPAGLSINSVTGVVDLASSTPGVYIVSNTIAAAGSCLAIVKTKSFTVTAVPDATFSYPGTPYCKSASNPSPTFGAGASAGTFSSSAGLSFVSVSTGAVDLNSSTAGAYTVTNSIAAAGGCAATSATSSINIVAPTVATFSYTGSPYCQTASNPFPTFSGGGVAGVFSELSGNLKFSNTATGQVNLTTSVAGIYTVTNTIAATATCPAQTATSSIQITAVPTATFSYTSGSYCKSGADPTPTVSGTSGGVFSSSVGLSINAATGKITLLTSNVGTYTVTYTIAAAGGCAAVSSTQNVTVTSSPVATFSYTGTPYCSSVADPSPTFSGGGSAGTFTAAAGVVFVSAATGQVDVSASTAGTYTITNSIAASGGCPSATATSSITIQSGSTGAFSYTGTPYCKTGTNPSPTFNGGGVAGTFSSTAGLSINSTTGAVNLGLSTAGTYTVTNTISASGACPLGTYTSSIVVSSPPIATFSYTASPYCSNAVNPSPAFSGGGVAGTFTTIGALNFVSAGTGQINLTTSTAGTYTVTNTVVSAGCANAVATSNVTITTVPVATISYAGSPYCKTAANPSPTLGGSAGTFSSTAGLTFISSATGQIDISASTAGTYVVTNTIAASSGCSIQTATTSVTITAPAVGTFSYTGTPYCQNASNPSPTFSGAGVAGTFSSTAGLSINSAGLVNLGLSTAGTYVVTNTIAASGPCASVLTTSSITIGAVPVSTFSYTGTPYCKNALNPSPVYSGAGVAGTFTSTAGLSINSSTGAVDLTLSTAGSYSVTNTVTASGCTAAATTSPIVITTVPNASFSYTASPYCSGGSDPSPVFPGGSSAGIFSSTAGLTFLSTATGQVDVSATTAATYTVTNTIASSGGCALTSATSTIQVITSPVATFSYTASPYCKNAVNPSPTYSGGGIAGTFTSTAGLSINSLTGAIDLSLSTAGTYTVTNTVPGTAPCSSVVATATITITTVPSGSFTYSAASFCSSGANPSPVLGVGASLGTFTSSAGLSINSASGVVTVQVPPALRGATAPIVRVAS